MKRESFDFGWKFGFGKPAFFGYEITEEVGIVDLPHDYTINSTPDDSSPNGRNTGYFNGAIGYYRKDFFVPDDIDNKITMLSIDGAYANSEVSINENVLSYRPYGYSPYTVDLTDYLVKGKTNEIRIITDNSIEQNSRWYTGSGLYRHVDILTSGPIHINPWGIYAKTTEVVDKNAVIDVEVTVENATIDSKSPLVNAALVDANGSIKAQETAEISLDSNDTNSLNLKLYVDDARLWDIDDPYLYCIKVQVIIDDEIVDTDSISFGIRSISMSAAEGFKLNGRSINLKGGCIHHDNGIIGSRAIDAAEFRKVKLHKDNGYNALRCAHNPPSRGLLNACDALGILVIDEAFDMWNMAKLPHDYHMHFMSWWERDIEAMLLRDRNHPSIIIWSIGNEIPERAGLTSGAKWSNRLANKVRSMDSGRFVINCICGIAPEKTEIAELTEYFAKYEEEQTNSANTPQESLNENYVDEFLLPKTEGFCSPLDVVGYNYLDRLYEKSHDVYPDRIICGTESFPIAMDTVWEYVEKLPYVIGDFTWTSFDYIGEAGIGNVIYSKNEEISDAAQLSSEYPWRLANCSDFDICGFDKPQLHYRKIVWGSSETYIAVRNPVNFGKVEKLSRWGWPDVEHIWDYPGFEDENIAIDVYSSAEEVELFIDDISMGRKILSKQDRYIAKFDVKYNHGMLRAVSYNNGILVSQDELKTAKEPVSVSINCDKDTLIADGQDIAYVTINIVDKDGYRVDRYEESLEVSVEGDGCLLGFSTGRTETTDDYSTEKTNALHGRALAAIRAAKTKGKVRIVAKGVGLNSGILELTTS